MTRSAQGKATGEVSHRGVGVANLHYDGKHVFVPFTGVSFDIDNGFVTRVTDWDFPDGTVRLRETYELIFVGNVIKFDSTVTVIDGGSGELQWKANSNPTALFNTFRQIDGSVCVGL
jgi:hypothetical protein